MRPNANVRRCATGLINVINSQTFYFMYLLIANLRAQLVFGIFYFTKNIRLYHNNNLQEPYFKFMLHIHVSRQIQCFLT